MTKKGELSVNVIIIVALGILVLVILAFVFADRIKDQDTASTCISKGGICKVDCGDAGVLDSSARCSNTEALCCNVV